MKNIVWMLYPVLGSLGAKGGRWSAEMQREISPNASKISQVGKDVHPMESVPKGFLANGVNRIHEEHVLDLISSTEVTGGKGWLAGSNGNVPQIWENCPRGDLFAHHGVRIGGIPGKQSMQNPWRTSSGCYIQYWGCWWQMVAGGVLRCRE